MIQAYCPNCENYVDYNIEFTVTGQVVIYPNRLAIIAEIETVCDECNHGIGITAQNILLDEVEVTPE